MCKAHYTAQTKSVVFNIPTELARMKILNGEHFNNFNIFLIRKQCDI